MGTAQDNSDDKVAKGRHSKGESNGSSKLNWEKVRELRAKYAKGDITLRALAAEYGITHQGISDVLYNRTWHDPEFEGLHGSRRTWKQASKVKNGEH